MSENKKSGFKVIMESIALEKFNEAKMPLKNLNSRNATVEEIKQAIFEAAKKAKKENEEAKKKDMYLFGDEVENGWGDAELCKQIEFVKALDIKEVFGTKKRK